MTPLMTGGDGNLVATSANVRISTGNTPRTGSDGGSDEVNVTMVNLADGGSSNEEEEKNDDGGTGGTAGQTMSTPAAAGTSEAPATGGSTPAAQQQPPPSQAMGHPQQQQPREQQQQQPAQQPPPAASYRMDLSKKRLRLPKFKGLDEPKMTVKAWLRAVRKELRRQLTIMRVEWFEREVFLEMVASFDGEALLCFDTVEDTLTRPEEQTFGNLSRLLKDRYMVKRSNPEIVARLRQRRQQRGEPLVEYAQKLREIVSGNDIGEEWLVDAFLAGMGHSWNAALVRGHKPGTLNAAVNAAIEQVGEYGEDYGVGLGAAMAQQYGRGAASGSAAVVNVGFG